MRLLAFGPETYPPPPTLASLAAARSPFLLGENAKILGFAIDDYFVLGVHVKDMLAKSQVRQGVLAKVGRGTWGLGTSVLRLTRDALVAIPLRFAMIAAGSCCPGDLINRLDTAVVGAAI